MNFKKMFDSVHRKIFRDLLRLPAREGNVCQTTSLLIHESGIQCVPFVIVLCHFPNTYMDGVLGKVLGRSQCGASVSNTNALDFVGDNIILAVTECPGDRS